MTEAPAFELAVVERPKQESNRQTGPNPFTAAVTQMVTEGTKDKAVSFKLEGVKKPVKGKTESGKPKQTLDTKVNRVLNQLRQAGEAQTPPVSVRTKVDYSGSASNATATVVFWTTEKITRKRAETAETATATE